MALLRSFTRGACAAVLASIVPAALLPAGVQAMTVEEAYQEIAHRHAALDPGAAGIGRDDAAFLSRLFELIDLAIVEKVQAWAWFQSEGRRGKPFPAYRERIEALIARIEALPAPERLRAPHRLLVDAIRDQRDFFASWEEAVQVSLQGKSSRGAHYARMNALRSSSARLHQVYDQLVRLFPEAGPQNFNAFYDHLCALDLL